MGYANLIQLRLVREASLSVRYCFPVYVKKTVSFMCLLCGKLHYSVDTFGKREFTYALSGLLDVSDSLNMWESMLQLQTLECALVGIFIHQDVSICEDFWRSFS